MGHDRTRRGDQTGAMNQMIAQGREAEVYSWDAGTVLKLHFARRLLGTQPKGNRLCHGDFHPGNAVVTQDAVSIIDWAGATQGSEAGVRSSQGDIRGLTARAPT